jgi:hypothetical protein
LRAFNFLFFFFFFRAAVPIRGSRPSPSRSPPPFALVSSATSLAPSNANFPINPPLVLATAAALDAARVASLYASASIVARRAVSRAGITPTTVGVPPASLARADSRPSAASRAASRSSAASTNAALRRCASVRARFFSAATRALCAYFFVSPLVRVPLGHTIASRVAASPRRVRPASASRARRPVTPTPTPRDARRGVESPSSE